MHNFPARKRELLYIPTKIPKYFFFLKKVIAFYIAYMYNTYNNSIIS